MAFSAFFSGMEIAFVSSNKLRFEMEKSNNFSTKILTIFYRNPNNFISTMLVGNNIALVIYGILMAEIIEQHLLVGIITNEVLLVVTQTIISTLIILITGEFLPKTLFKINPNLTLKIFCVPTFLCYLILYPISKFSALVSTTILRLAGKKIKKEDSEKAFSKVDLDYLIESSIDDTIKENEIEPEIQIFRNVLDFSNIKVKDCMIPRTEIIAAETGTSKEEIMKIFIDSGLSKLIIYRDNIDNIIGYIHSSEMFNTHTDWENNIKSIPVVPESMSANKLMQLLMQQKKTLAVIVDEFGGTSGIIALEDLVEELLGDIEDEHDNKNTIAKEINENEYILSGRLEIEEINEKCRKVLTYKYAFGLNKRSSIEKNGVMSRINKAYTNDLMSRIKKSAVTVVKDSDEMLPLDLTLSGTVVLNVSNTLSETYPFFNEINDTYPVTWLHANLDSLQSLRNRIIPAQRVIVAVYTSKVEKYRKVLLELAKGKPTILVCFNSHKVLQKLNDVVAQSSAVVLAHSDEKYIQKFVAGMLIGNQRVDGRLSVDLNDEYKAGSGVIVDPDKPRRYKPEEFGMDSKVLSRIDSIAEYGIKEGAYPGCHVLVWKNGYQVYNKCFGNHTYESDREVRENDLYDLASLTKTTATLLAVMKLYDEGKINLTDKISDYVPELKSTDKESITIQQLLYHESGLPAYLPFYKKAIDPKSCKGGMYKKYKDANHKIKVGNALYVCTNFEFLPEWVSEKDSAGYTLKLSDGIYIKPEFKNVILKEIADASLKGHSYRYSCLNFMLLKEAVENISGMPIDKYLEENFYKPMGLVHTLYNPLQRYGKDDIVPTVKEDFLRKGPVHGYVHDEAAAMMGGVSGNAGLFSTAKDVATIYQMLLDKGVMGDRRYLTRATCELFITMKSKNSRRGLGFDKPDADKPGNGYCAPETPASVFGHTGFTGTCAWADPDNDLVFVFLCNRIYPNPCDRKNLMKLKIRPAIQQAIYQAIMK